MSAVERWYATRTYRVDPVLRVPSPAAVADLSPGELSELQDLVNRGYFRRHSSAPGWTILAGSAAAGLGLFGTPPLLWLAAGGGVPGAAYGLYIVMMMILVGLGFTVISIGPAEVAEWLTRQTRIGRAATWVDVLTPGSVESRFVDGAARAVTGIQSSPHWQRDSSGHRGQLDLVDQLAAIKQRCIDTTRLGVEIRGLSDPVAREQLQGALSQALQHTHERVRALTRYQHHLALVDALERQLVDQDRLGGLTDRVNSLLAASAGDQHNQAHLAHLTTDLDQRLEALQETLTLLNGDLDLMLDLQTGTDGRKHL